MGRPKRLVPSVLALTLCLSSVVVAQSLDSLKTALLGTKTDEERASLIATHAAELTPELVAALNAEGGRLRAERKAADALAAYHVADMVAERIGDKAGAAAALSGLGGIYTRQGRLDEAAEPLVRALAFREVLGDRHEMLRILYTLGTNDLRRYNLDPALDYLSKALPLAEELNDSELRARTLTSISGAYKLRGDLPTSRQYIDDAIRIAEPDGNKQLIVTVLNQAGDVYYLQGDFVRSLEVYERALPLAEDMHDELGIDMAMQGLELAAQKQENYALAIEYDRKLLAALDASGHSDGVAVALGEIGSAFAGDGDFVQAVDYLTRAVSIARRSQNAKYLLRSLLGLLGWIAIGRGNAKGAIDFFDEALANTDDAGLSGSEGHLVGLAAANNLEHRPERALELARHAIASLGGERGNPDFEWMAELEVGRAQVTLGQLEPARAAFERAVSIVETLRNRATGDEQDAARFFAVRSAPYGEMVELLVKQGRAEEALAYAERAKGRALLDVLENGRTDVTRSLSPAERDEERRLKTAIAMLNTQVAAESAGTADAKRLGVLHGKLDDARLAYEALQTNLFASHPELRIQRGRARIATPKEIDAIVPERTGVLLEYVVGEHESFVIAVARPAQRTSEIAVPRVVRLGVGRVELMRRVAKFRDVLASRSLEFQAPARELFDTLLGPVREELRRATSLVIVPDGPLWEVPFQALQPAPNHFLVEQCAISYAPSLTVLRDMSAVRRGRARGAAAGETLLAFGNPSLGGVAAKRAAATLMAEPLAPLPDAERQVSALKRLYGPARSRVYVGSAATEERVKAEAGSCRILHFATHGVLDNASPMYSSVVLSQENGGTGEDGLLEAWEVMKLDLKADLVVFSACETARGRIGAGEGVIGLAWAAFVAGCPTTVVSQWKVDAASTTDLMIAFHRGLRPSRASSGVSTARALQAASLKLLSNSEYRHPFYWAAFEVVGDGS